MENIIALIAATTVLVLIPGPNVALIVANSLGHGCRLGLITVLGTTMGLGLQLVIVVFGLAALIELASSALAWVRWLGVAYLVYLAVRTWRQPATGTGEVTAGSASRAFWRGLVFAIVNPKTLLFNAAFLPQFVASPGNAATELGVVALVFLLVVVIGDSLWAVSAGSARAWIHRYGMLRNRLTGGFLMGAALGLAVSRRTG